MSPDPKALIALELEQIALLVASRRSLMERSLRDGPTIEELDALAALLHSAYTAMERVMTHIAKHEGCYDSLHSKSYMWHGALLQAMAARAAERPPIIGVGLCNQLKQYLGFRHVFRHAYLHELQWSKMKPLVEELTAVARSFEEAIQDYCQRCWTKRLRRE